MRAADGTIAGDLTNAGPAVVTLTPADLAEVGEELARYHARFAPLFARREQRAWAEVYLRGLLLADVARKTVDAMALGLLGAGPPAARQVRALQQFIGAGAWDDTAILAEHQRVVAASLGEHDGVLILDGSEVPKRGVHSAGVAAQGCRGAGPPARPTPARRASFWATPAARATRCWIGGCSCRSRGLTTRMPRCGGRAAFPLTWSSGRKRSWRPRWSSRCSSGATSPPPGWSATRGWDALQRGWSATTPPACGS